MSFTGQLGTSNSQLGEIELGTLPISTFTQSVGDTLSLTQSVTADNIISESVSHTLAFSQSVVAHKSVHQSVSDPISFSQVVAFLHDPAASVTDTLSLTDTAVGQAFHHVADTLSFSQTAIAEFPHRQSVSHSLGLTQSTGVIGPHYINLRQPLNITDAVSDHSDTVHVSVADTLTLTDQVGRQIPITVSQSLSLASTGIRPTTGHDTLALAQAVAAGKGSDFLDDLGLTDAVAHQGIFFRHVADDLGLRHSDTFLNDQQCLEWNYDPQVGSSSDGSTTPPSTTAPTLGDGTLTLTYPFVSPSLTVALRNPAFDNKDSLNFTRINRQTLGGHLTVFADPIWPKLKTLTMPLVAVRRPAVDNLVAFLQASAGKEIGLLDYENRQWRGVVTNPDMDISETERNAHSFTIQFEGDLA